MSLVCAQRIQVSVFCKVYTGIFGIVGSGTHWCRSAEGSVTLNSHFWLWWQKAKKIFCSESSDSFQLLFFIKQNRHVDLDSVSVRKTSTVVGLGHARINSSVPVPKRINPH